MTTLSIRSYHLDGYGHVNNARYLEFLEEARWAWFEAAGLLPLLGDTQLVVSRIDIRYRRPSTAGDVLQINSHIRDVQPRQVLLTQNIVLAGSDKSVVEAELTLVPVSGQTGRATDLNEALFNHLVSLAEPIA